MSREAFLLSIDIGTGGAKAGLFDLNGELAGLCQQEYRFQHPHPGWSELDPEEVWEKVKQVVRGCTGGLDPARQEILALGLSVLGETSFPVDEDDRPVYPAIESMDKRANAYQEYLEWFEARFDRQSIFERTSYPINSMTPAVKILWLRENLPEVYRRIAKWVTFQDFVLWRMTGKPFIDYSLASRTMLFDARQKCWIPEYLDAMGLQEDFFSPPVIGSQPAGRLKAGAARELGLPEGILVVPGAHDQSCAALGVGVVREGAAGDGTGSVEAISTVTRTPLASAEMLQRGQGSQCHVAPDLYLALTFHLSAGSLVRWYRDQLGQWEQDQAHREGQDPYDLITDTARRSPPGANGLLVLPHWSGAGTGRTPALNPNSRGAILGFNLTHTKSDLNRAIFEGITYEARYLIESLESTGIQIKDLLVTGGGAKSPFWLQMKADITGKRILVPSVTEASLLGAALLAGVGAGVYANIETAVERTIRSAGVYNPNPELAPVYDRGFAIYRDLYEDVIALSGRLAQFTSR
ncbi:MAG: FGGY-family carbohydrate kinase [Omnitrophica WOR_2 bacterium]